ncbi:MAG: hypothetical protein JXJ04_25205 [Spirochaetales bacterium]|nr:hypothetical protein [Spirochaetales bacterium]
MKIKYTLFLLAIAFLLIIFSCFLFGTDFIDQNLQGEIQHVSFNFVSGYAATNSINEDEWTIYLHNVEPQEGLEPYDPGAYTSGSVCYFNILKNSNPQLYEVDTFGINNTLGVYATNGTGIFTTFDEGELEIETIDTENGEISGRMWVDVIPSSGGSHLNGNFSVVIDPASIDGK